MKSLQLFENFTGNFSIFSKLFKNFIEFFAKIWAKIYVVFEICICRWFTGRRPRPEASEFTKILGEKK